MYHMAYRIMNITNNYHFNALTSLLSMNISLIRILLGEVDQDASNNAYWEIIMFARVDALDVMESHVMGLIQKL